MERWGQDADENKRLSLLLVLFLLGTTIHLLIVVGEFVKKAFLGSFEI